jgi:hypothetical protein
MNAAAASHMAFGLATSMLGSRGAEASSAVHILTERFSISEGGKR